MLFHFTSYSKYLAAELLHRKANNDLYSLRSMSQQLGVSASTLSDVIKGNKKFSEKTGLLVSTKLKLSAKEVKYFQTLIHYENSEDENLKKLLENQLIVLNPLLRKKFEVTEQQYIVLSEWYHFAILEMTYLFPDYMDAQTVSRQLNIDLALAESALALLVDLDLLEKKHKTYIKTKVKFTFSSDLANQAIRHFHRSMLGKAQSALVEQTNKEKFIGSETFPLSPANLEEAKEIIEICFQQLLRLSERATDRSHVYHAGIQIFQLSRPLRTGTADEQ